MSTHPSGLQGRVGFYAAGMHLLVVLSPGPRWCQSQLGHEPHICSCLLCLDTGNRSTFSNDQYHRLQHRLSR